MNVVNIDLLPPLYDQILGYFGIKSSGTQIRADIIKNLKSCFVDAAVRQYNNETDEALRPKMGTSHHVPKSGNSEYVSLKTSDRLSGSDLSRAALAKLLRENVELPQENPSLGATLIEIALLLIEAQIDLRLQSGAPFKIDGIEYSRGFGERSNEWNAETTDWCRSILASAIQSATEDKSTIWSLSASRFQRILLPGNHDRYAGEWIPGQRLDLTCEEILQIPNQYPYMLGFRPPNSKNSLTLLFLVFDSTLQAGRDRFGLRGASLERALAKGEIKDAELTEARKLVTKIMEKKKVESIGGGTLEFDPLKTIRIALLHHHPVTKFVKSKKPEGVWDHVKNVKKYFAKREAKAMSMENSEAFLKCCFDCGIQLILFGHQHDPYQRLVIRSLSSDRTVENVSIEYPSKDKSASIIKPSLETDAKSTASESLSRYMHAFCCPSTLQYDVPDKGFYIFDFHSENHFEWIMYQRQLIDDQRVGPMEEVERMSYDLSRELTQDEIDKAHKVSVA
jgi:hypothetical protein